MSEKIGDNCAFPVLLQLNDERVFALNFSDQYEISNNSSRDGSIYDEETYYDYSRDIGLNGYQKHALPQMSQKIMRALPPKEQLTSADLQSSLKTVMRHMTRSSGSTTLDMFDLSKSRLDERLAEIAAIETRVR